MSVKGCASPEIYERPREGDGVHCLKFRLANPCNHALSAGTVSSFSTYGPSNAHLRRNGLAECPAHAHRRLYVPQHERDSLLTDPESIRDVAASQPEHAACGGNDDACFTKLWMAPTGGDSFDIYAEQTRCVEHEATRVGSHAAESLHEERNLCVRWRRFTKLAMSEHCDRYAIRFRASRWRRLAIHVALEVIDVVDARSLKSIFDMEPAGHRRKANVRAVARPVAVTCARREPRTNWVVVNVSNRRRGSHGAERPIGGAAREEWTEPVAVAVHPQRERRVYASTPPRERFLAGDRSNVNMVAHHRVGDAFPIAIFERSTEPPEVAAAVRFVGDEPLAIQATPDEMVNQSGELETGNAHARAYRRMQAWDALLEKL